MYFCHENSGGKEREDILLWVRVADGSQVPEEGPVPMRMAEAPAALRGLLCLGVLKK